MEYNSYGVWFITGFEVIPRGFPWGIPFGGGGGGGGGGITRIFESM